MTDIHAALGELLRAHHDQVQVAAPSLADFGDLVRYPLPDVQVRFEGEPLPPGIQGPLQERRVVLTYHVTAPCRLAQLQDAVVVGSERAGGRGSGGSRPLIAADALDLWRDVVTSASMWAVAVGVDRGRYLKRPTPTLRRTADLVHEAAHAFATLDTPPVGRLLRAAATEADRRGLDAMVATVARQARSWAGRIDALFGAPESKAMRGVACHECGRDTILEVRPDDGVYRIPALTLSYGQDGEMVRAFQSCRACGDWAWIDPDYARRQQIMAAVGEADGQCEGCGAYRIDGHAPWDHRPGCVEDDVGEDAVA